MGSVNGWASLSLGVCVYLAFGYQRVGANQAILSNLHPIPAHIGYGCIHGSVYKHAHIHVLAREQPDVAVPQPHSQMIGFASDRVCVRVKLRARRTGS